MENALPSGIQKSFDEWRSIQTFENMSGITKARFEKKVDHALLYSLKYGIECFLLSTKFLSWTGLTL